MALDKPISSSFQTLSIALASLSPDLSCNDSTNLVVVDKLLMTETIVKHQICLGKLRWALPGDLWPYVEATPREPDYVPLYPGRK
jgi:hypothetical protein